MSCIGVISTIKSILSSDRLTELIDENEVTKMILVVTRSTDWYNCVRWELQKDGHITIIRLDQIGDMKDRELGTRFVITIESKDLFLSFLSIFVNCSNSITMRFVKRREICSSSSGIPGEVLVRTGRTNLLDAMQGLVPGLTVSNGRAVIRGVGTINGSTDPLFILDGVEVASLAFVSVSDVESVEVQKDGSMYGSKGANGVIRVTTKHGKKKR